MDPFETKRDEYRSFLKDTLVKTHIIEPIAKLTASYTPFANEGICDWCCKENCAAIQLDNRDVLPFQTYCDQVFQHKYGELTIEIFYANYRGLYANIAEFVKEMVNDHNMPDFISNHVNWEGLCDEMVKDYSYYDGYVFQN